MEQHPHTPDDRKHSIPSHETFESSDPGSAEPIAHQPPLPEHDRTSEHSEPAETRPAVSPVDQGIREYGDPFRAYLRLSEVDRHRPDLLQTFRDAYIGSFPTMDAVLGELTDVNECLAQMKEVARSWGFEDYVNLDRRRLWAQAHETWDIWALGGRLHVFNK